MTREKTVEDQRRWTIGLDAWIIQDGNYPDLYQGQVAEFAVEFYQHELTFLETRVNRQAHQKDHDLYQVSGEVIYVSDDSWVLDFGLRVYQDGEPPNGIRVGSCVAADVSLGVANLLTNRAKHGCRHAERNSTAPVGPVTPL